MGVCDCFNLELVLIYFFCPTQPGFFHHQTDLRCHFQFGAVLSHFEQFIDSSPLMLVWAALSVYFWLSNQFSAQSTGGGGGGGGGRGSIYDTCTQKRAPIHTQVHVLAHKHTHLHAGTLARTYIKRYIITQFFNTCSCWH